MLIRRAFSAGLGGDVASLQVFRGLGVRVMQLSYNRRSPFAAGVMEPAAGGLTLLGREAVREMKPPRHRDRPEPR